MDDQRRIAEAIADTTIHRAADRTQRNDQVIEAAAKGLYELTSMYQTARIPWADVAGTVRDLFLREAESAIRAADAARAEAVKESRWPLDNAVVGVNLLIRLALDYMENGGEDTRDQFFKARDAIIEGLAGAPEQ